MQNEKMQILKMLEDGKISADEAARLLEVINNGGSVSGRLPRENESQDAKAPAWESAPGGNNTGSGYGRAEGPAGGYGDSDKGNARAAGSQYRGTGGGGGYNDFAEELVKKFEAFAKDFEPKLHKWTGMVAEKTVEMADQLYGAFQDAPRPGGTGGVAAGGEFMDMELLVTPGYNELGLTGLNGNVSIKGYNGDKITAKVQYKAKTPGASIRLMQLGNKYYLAYDEDEFRMVSITAYVPEAMFQQVTVSTINANLEAASLEAERCIFTTTNASVLLKNIRAKHLKAEGGNGRVELQQIVSENALVDNYNGKIDFFDVDIANLQANTSNAPITLQAGGLFSFGGYVWALDTSNGKIRIDAPSGPAYGFYVKAHATMSGIKLGLPNLNYVINDPSLAEAKTAGFDECAKKIRLSLATSNGGITVNH